MAEFNRVMDYFKGMPDNKNHRDIYFEKYFSEETKSAMKGIDFLRLEKDSICAGERNVIRAFSCQSKFTLHNMARGFSLSAVSSASGNGPGREHLDHEQKEILNFESDLYWYLMPATSSVSYSTRSSTALEHDTTMRSKILSACTNMSGGDTANLNLVGVQEKLSLESNLEYLFTKMYLILQDYNLAVTSKMEERNLIKGFRYSASPGITSQGRLAAILRHDIVIDTDGFTNAELGLLTLAGAQYPSVWYAGDNIYNACNMEADNLILVSNGEINPDLSFSWGSPDRLYNMICQLACKLDSVRDMMKAFANMRGKCQLMKDMREKVDFSDVPSGMPLGRNMMRALGGANLYASTIQTCPGYMSSSYSLVADLLLGMQFKAAATCVVEELGGYGDQLCGDDPLTHRTFNGLARDYGLDHDDIRVNILLLNWHSISGSPMTWGFGDTTKRYVIQIASDLRQGLDIPLPQIMHLIPYSHTHNTAWGYCRGWNGLAKPVLSSGDEISESQTKLVCFAWMIGMVKERPKVFRNRGHKSKTQRISPEVYRLDSISPDGYTLKGMRIFMTQTLGGRLDENERITRALFKTEYAGSDCSLVYDISRGLWDIPSVSPPDYNQMFRTTVEGRPKGHDPIAKEDIQPITYGAPRVPELVMQKIGALASPKIKLDSRKQHVGGNRNDRLYVAPYSIGGETTTTPLLDCNPEINEGEIISIEEIDVPGDGQCGLHAIAEDLKAHGYLDGRGAAQIHSNFRGELSTDDFHDAQELAGLLMTYGFGMDIYDEDKNGELSLQRFGDAKVKHRVTLLRRMNHFVAVKYGGTTEKKVSHVSKSDKSNADLISDIEKFRKFFIM